MLCARVKKMKIICVFLVLYVVAMHKMKIHRSTAKPSRLWLLRTKTTLLAPLWSGYPASKRAGAAVCKHMENRERQTLPLEIHILPWRTASGAGMCRASEDRRRGGRQ